MRLLARTLALILAARRPEKPAPVVSTAVMPPVVGEAPAIKHRDLYAANFEVVDESTLSPHRKL